MLSLMAPQQPKNDIRNTIDPITINNMKMGRESLSMSPFDMSLLRASELTTITPMPISCKLSSNLSRYCNESYIYIYYLAHSHALTLKNIRWAAPKWISLARYTKKPSIIYAWLTKDSPVTAYPNRTQLQWTLTLTQCVSVAYSPRRERWRGILDTWSLLLHNPYCSDLLFCSGLYYANSDCEFGARLLTTFFRLKY